MISSIELAAKMTDVKSYYHQSIFIGHFQPHREVLSSATFNFTTFDPYLKCLLGSYRCLFAWCRCRYAHAWPSKFYHAASCLEFSLSRIEDYCDIGRCKIYSKRMGNLNMFPKSPCSFWKENVAYRTDHAAWPI